MDICNSPWPKSHIHFSISLGWYKGVEEAHSTQYKRYSFSWKGRVHARGPQPDQLGSLSSQISNSFSVNSSWQVGAGFVPCEYYQSCNMKAGGKEGRREGRKVLMVIAVTQGTSNGAYRNEIFWVVFCYFHVGRNMPSGLSKETTQMLKLHCTTALGRGDHSLVAGRACPKTFCKHCQMSHYLCTAS